MALSAPFSRHPQPSRIMSIRGLCIFTVSPSLHRPTIFQVRNTPAHSREKYEPPHHHCLLKSNLHFHIPPHPTPSTRLFLRMLSPHPQSPAFVVRSVRYK